MTDLSQQRRLDMLTSALGALRPWLDKDTVTEIMLNPDGRVWVQEQGKEMAKTGITLNRETAERIIRLIASAAGMEITPANPSLAAKLPHWGPGCRHPSHRIVSMDRRLISGCRPSVSIHWLIMWLRVL